MKVQGDDKLSDAEKAQQVAALKAEIARIEAMEKQIDSDPYQQRIAAFIAADKAGKTDEMKKMIAEFAAGFASTQ
jgi:phosphonate transport system substrate-binding protein